MELSRERKYNNISYLSKLVRSERSESYWERTWRDEYSSVQPSRMLKPHKGEKPSWRTKTINGAVTTKSEIKSMPSSEASRKSLQENTKCPWCTCSGFNTQRFNPSWKKIEDTTEKDESK